MAHYKYLIVGGGMTADAAVQGIREIDQQGSIGMISRELHPPYNRPPLSKALWKGDPIDTIWRGTEKRNVTMHLGRTAALLDVNKKMIADDIDNNYTFDKLLLATGGTPRRLPYGGNDIIYYRTLDDYLALRLIAEKKDRFAIIGGGFIGCEVAAALAMNGKKVTMLFPEEGLGFRIFPADMARFLNDFYRSKNVEILAGESVTNAEKRGASYVVQTKSGKEIPADCIIAGIGIQPDITLATVAGLPCDNGIIVDDYLRTTHPDIYAAGDVANFHSPILGKRLRLEHEDNANTMGKIAGHNMAGNTEPYHYIPMFYSDLFDLGYEAAGDLDSRLETVADWKEPFREGVVYYLQDDRVRGVLLVNTWGQVDNARKLIEEKGPFSAQNLKNRLPA
ncbi:MAG TPA: FAD-dependent oxidoreductase [Candidatus Kapabacteria bacterium]|nr:FAD-dependent oxidoreductase [Candidatus Kapabacteria bacterium]